MMKKHFRYTRLKLSIAHCLLPIAYCLLPFAFCLLSVQSKAQYNSGKKHKIAIFTPLYLDSAFDGNNEYRYSKNTLPNFINSGLEFFEGAQLALDSLALTDAPLEIFVYDTRSAHETLEEQLAKPELNDAELIIANCSSNEIRAFSNIALTKKIPVINATIPNDAGIYANPYFVILNPTLKTQCEGIYQFVQKKFTANPVTVFRKKGRADDMIKTMFDDYSRSSLLPSLLIKYVELNDSFTVAQLTPHLDSTRQNVCIAGTLDINFGKRLALQLASINKQYPATVIGMPTWDIIRDFSKPEYRGIEIIYSTPFHNPRTDKTSEMITDYFSAQVYARPSDMVFRGYEVTWKFAKLLLQYGNDLSSNLSNKSNHVFTEYNIQPVINKNTMTLDYFENKKLYFVRWMDGVSKVN